MYKSDIINTWLNVEKALFQGTANGKAELPLTPLKGVIAMKNILCAVIFVLVVVGAVVFYNKRTSEVPQQQRQNVATKIKTETPPQEEDRELTFWCGEVIVGEDENCGKLELLAHTGRKSVVLTIDDECKYCFDSVPGMKPGTMYIRLQDGDKPPLISFKEFNEGEEVAMFPVYQLTARVKEMPIRAVLLRDIESPVERRYRQDGQHFSGPTWSLASREVQLYGEGRTRR